MNATDRKATAQKINASRTAIRAIRAEFTGIAARNGGRSGARNGAPAMSAITTSSLTKHRMGHATPTNSDLRFYFENEAQAQAATDAMVAYLAGVDMPASTGALAYTDTF